MSGALRKVTGLLSQPTRYKIRKILYSGKTYTCPLCLSSVRQYLPHGGGFDVLDRRKVVGGMRREDDQCPACRSADRTRLMMLYLEKKAIPARAGQKLRVLHVAPEYGLFLWLGRQKNIEYHATDLDLSRYRHIPGIQKADLTKLPQADNSFDLVICSHVLEHVPDDRAAMREILRVLKPGGTALLMVPLAHDDKGTEEEPTIHNPSEQERRFGQWDHVRLYEKTDFMARVQEAGLAVLPFNGFDQFPQDAKSLRLNPEETLITGHKPV